MRQPVRCQQGQKLTRGLLPAQSFVACRLRLRIAHCFSQVRALLGVNMFVVRASQHCWFVTMSGSDGTSLAQLTCSSLTRQTANMHGNMAKTPVPMGVVDPVRYSAKGFKRDASVRSIV